MSSVLKKSWRPDRSMRLDLDSGARISIAVERDDEGEDHTILRIDGKALVSEDPEASLADVYAPTGLEWTLLRDCMDEVFQQWLRDELHLKDAQDEHYHQRRAQRGFR